MNGTTRLPPFRRSAWLLRHDIPQLIQQSDVFVNFSKYEGLPLAVIEAFASGIITVISPIHEHLVIGEFRI